VLMSPDFKEKISEIAIYRQLARQNVGRFFLYNLLMSMTIVSNFSSPDD